jgi:hypothetical protein
VFVCSLFLCRPARLYMAHAHVYTRYTHIYTHAHTYIYIYIYMYTQLRTKRGRAQGMHGKGFISSVFKHIKYSVVLIQRAWRRFKVRRTAYLLLLVQKWDWCVNERLRLDRHVQIHLTNQIYGNASLPTPRTPRRKTSQADISEIAELRLEAKFTQLEKLRHLSRFASNSQRAFARQVEQYERRRAEYVARRLTGQEGAERLLADTRYAGVCMYPACVCVCLCSWMCTYV